MRNTEELFKLAGNVKVGDVFPCLEFVHVVSGFKGKLMRIYEKDNEVIDEMIRVHRERIGEEDEDEECLVDALLRLQMNGLDITSDDIKSVLGVSFYSVKLFRNPIEK